MLAIVYGGIEKNSQDLVVNAIESRKAPFWGNLLALIASIWYGLFQVMYKKVVALPNDPEVGEEGGNGLDESAPLSASSSTTCEDAEDLERLLPESPPFALHPNFMISIVGFLTFVIMAIPFPFLHYLDFEPFILPSDSRTVLSIMSIAFMGLVFNSGFMVCLMF